MVMKLLPLVFIFASTFFGICITTEVKEWPKMLEEPPLLGNNKSDHQPDSGEEKDELVKLKKSVATLAVAVKQNAYDRIALATYVMRAHDLESVVPQAIIYGIKLDEGYVYVEEFNMAENPSVHPDCMDLTTVNANVESVNSLGSCVRLYEGPDCSGANIWISGYFTNLKESFGPIKSIGACSS